MASNSSIPPEKRSSLAAYLAGKGSVKDNLKWARWVAGVLLTAIVLGWTGHAYLSQFETRAEANRLRQEAATATDNRLDRQQELLDRSQRIQLLLGRQLDTQGAKIDWLVDQERFRQSQEISARRRRHSRQPAQPEPRPPPSRGATFESQVNDIMSDHD